MRNVKPGQTLVYNDGREGHQNVMCTVLSVSKTGMTVQFEDRADTTKIRFSEREWMDHLHHVNFPYEIKV